jgi:hypothetical protein
MKISLLAVGLLLTVQTGSAAIQYEFRQSKSSDSEGALALECTGRAIIDGEKSRVEFLTGNFYPIGAFVLTSNGSRTLTFVDPSKKSYADVNAAAVATAIGSAKIDIGDKKSVLTQLDDHPVIAGIPTDHYRMAIEYQITMTFGNVPLTQTVHTIIDRWTTMAFGDVSETFLSGGALRTGNAGIDELVSMENSKVKGFPLKQIVQTTAVNNRARAAPSQLAINRTTTVTRELVITSIQPLATVAQMTFMVPLGFRKADPLRDDTQKTPMQVLSMEPAKP